MRDTHASWQSLIDRWPGALVTIDRDDRIAALHRTNGLIDTGRDLGRDLFELVVAEDHAALRAAFVSARTAADAVEHAASIRFIDEPRRSRDFQLVPLAAGAIGLIATDVSATRHVRRSEERLRILEGATRAFSEASESPEQLFAAIVRYLGEALHCASALAFVADDGVHFTTVHVHAPDPDASRMFRSYLVDGGPRRLDAHPAINYVVETGKPLFAPRLMNTGTGSLGAGDTERAHAFAERMHLTSVLVVPLRVRHRVSGVLSLSRYGHQPLLEAEDLALAQSLADQASLALTTSRLIAASEREDPERERTAARVRLLAEAKHETTDVMEESDLLASIARRLGEAIGDFCTITTVSEDGSSLELSTVHHRDPEVVAWARQLMANESMRMGEGLVGRVAASGQAVFIPRVEPAAHDALTVPKYLELVAYLHVGSVIAAPMVCRGKVVGVALLLRSGRENPYTEADRDLVASLADHAALSIANARSHAAERAARTALDRSEIAHQLLFAASPVPLLVFDVETHALLAVNDATLRLYGYRADEMLRMKLTDLRADRDTEFVRAAVPLGDENELRGTALHRRKDGADLFIEYRSRPLLLGGRHARITVVADRNTRREAEEMRALLAAVVQSSNDAIVTKRLDGTITTWNEAAERLFGYSAAEMIGRNVARLVPEGRLPEERALLEQVTAGDRVEHYETVRRRKDGTEVVVSLSLARILDASGRVIGVSKTARDLTAQRSASLVLQSTEEQLRQAQKMEAVGRLAGGIAHDFNNVLSIILSYVELILADLEPEDPLVEDIGQIRKAAVRAADLTRQLLMFSRQQVVATKVIDLNDLLAGLDKIVRRIVGDDVELVLAPEPGLGRVLADPSSVEQVIMNLVVNARDAMPTGGKLTIATANVTLDGSAAAAHLGAAAGPHVRISVSDNGHGMSREVQARIFEPFFTTKEVGKGTGLGLSTVFGIAQQSGGSVGVESTPGEGTTFMVNFPCVDADAAERHSDQRKTSRGSETILLVEDEPQVRAVAHSILRRNGYRVIVAQNGADAIELSASFEGPIDILVTDVVMPRMSGATLAKAIGVSRPATRILCMSGYTDDSVVRHGVLESEVAFLQKPFTPESLTRMVREVLDAPAVQNAPTCCATH